MDKKLNNADLWETITSSARYWGGIFPDDRDLISRESLIKLTEINSDLTGEDDKMFLDNLVFAAHRSYRYVEARINSLYAFRDLYRAFRGEFPIAQLSSALDGLAPRCDRSHAIDYSLPERYESARPVLEAVMGVMSLNSWLADQEYLIRSNTGAVEAKPELVALIRKYPDKAALVAPLLHKRGYKIKDMETAGDVLCDMPSPLMEGAL